MSQHRMEGNTAKGRVEILIGWDQPLAYFFMVIEPDLDPPLYSNLDESDPASLTPAHFQTVLDRFGITDVSLRPGHASGLYEILMTDRDNGR
ncbi:hypothetical protein [Pectobacterium versatile]|uniref:hypothetical protein n=1 Tax=Pectobacterium versatile TaxID=2488639 RepID=UPI001F314E10|nr:hypothetical protein [Pectobacterium versatile]